MSHQAVELQLLQTEKMASDNVSKRLAQLYYVINTGMNRQSMIIEKVLKDYINIDHELPTSAFFQLEKPELLNSTALELAFKKDNIEIFNIFIQHGADFTRKNKQGSTVLHQSINTSVYNDDSTYWSMNTQQLSNQFAKSVLCAHIEYDNSSNPRNEHGMSHFHAACMMNHAQAVQFFLDSGVSPDQAINNDSPILPGYTPLHLAAKFGAVDTLQLLLQSDAKIKAKNAKGLSPLQLLMKDKVEIWIEQRKLTRDIYNRSDYHVYLDGIERMMHMILRKFHPQTQIVDEATGVSRFHIACTTTNPRAIREQLALNPDLQHSVNASSALWPGYTPLHFAAHYDYHVFKLLLDVGADLLAMDASGMTPFDICLQNFELCDVEDILRRKDDWANVCFSNGRTRLLDCVAALRSSTEFEIFLISNFADVNARIPEEWGLCQGFTPLHLAVTCCERLRERRDNTLRMNEIMAYRYGNCIEACLQLGADVTVKNNQGLTPLHLAFYLKSDTLIKTLLDRQTSAENPRDKAGLSHLHIASLANHPSLARRLPRCSKDLEAPLEIGDFDWATSRRIRNGAMPLSIALSVGARETVEALVERGARIPVDDVERFAKMDGALGLLSRLHPLDVEGVLRHCEPKLLMAEMTKNAQLRNYLVERRWLTRLHVAVLVGEDIDELTDDVNAIVPPDSPVWPDCTALHLLVVSQRFPKAVTDAHLLLDRGANVTMTNAHGATPVHDAFDWFMRNPDVMSLFDTLLSQSDANPVDPRGISHFHIATMFNRVDTVKGYLRNNVDVDGKIDEFSDVFAGLTALHLAVIFGCDEVVEILLAHGADVHCESVVGNRPIHCAANTGLAPEIGGVVKSLMRAGADINGKNLFEETPLEKLLKSGSVRVEIVELFVKYGCKVNVVNAMSNQGCLALALILQDKSIYKSLINVYDHNELDECDRSAMHNIVLLNRSLSDLPMSKLGRDFDPITGYVAAIQELSGKGLDINFQDKLGMTPLHLAVVNQNLTGVTSLLKCGADININEINGFPPISAAMTRALNVAEILENFWMHIWKLRFFKLHVSNFNLEADSRIQGRTWFKSRVIHNHNVEIQSMVKEKIGAIALRDFLSETGVVAAYPTMLYDLRSSIDEYFKTNWDSLLDEFPELCGILMLQYRKAKKRLDMAESYVAALNYLVNFDIPHLCSDRIFRFLTYDDLKNVISSASFE